MDIFAAFATDVTKENEGVWVEVGDSEFLIARSGNQEYSKKISREFERHRKLLERKDDAADALSEKIMVDVLSETILLGWKNVQFKGEELPYNAANAKMLLGIKDFRSQVIKLADDFNSYKVDQEESEVKN